MNLFMYAHFTIIWVRPIIAGIVEFSHVDRVGGLLLLLWGITINRSIKSIIHSHSPVKEEGGIKERHEFTVIQLFEISVANIFNSI